MKDGLLNVDWGAHDIGQVRTLIVRQAGDLLGTRVETSMELSRALGQIVRTGLELSQSIAQLHDAGCDLRSFRSKGSTSVSGIIDGLIKVLSG